MARPGVLTKVVQVLDAFGPDDHALSFTELRHRTGLAKATLHRIAADMVDAQLLDRTDAGFRLSRKVFEIGMRVLAGRGLLELAMPYLEDLYEQTHETVHLGVREGAEVVYLAKNVGHRAVAAPSRLGGRMPLHATAIGKVLLAHAPHDVRVHVLSQPLHRHAPRTMVRAGELARELESVRESGIAYEFEESAVGVACGAAPVRDGAGRVVAAVSVSGPITRFLPQRRSAAVCTAALGISQALARSAWSSA